MKYGTQSGVYGADLAEAIKEARAHGCEGFEMGYPVDALRTGSVKEADILRRAQEDARVLRETGFEAISVSPGIIFKHVQHPNCIEAACRTANILGTRALRVFASPHVRLGGPNSTLTEWTAEYDGTSSHWEWYGKDSERLQVFVDFAQKYDVRWVFELHHGYAATSPSAMRRLLDRYSPRYVGTIMDPGNMVYEGNEGWRNGVQILGEYLDYIHCKNTRYDQDESGKWTGSWESLEKGIADFPQIMTALKDIGFQGYLCIEDLRRGIPPEEKIQKAIAYLRALEASDQRVMPA